MKKVLKHQILVGCEMYTVEELEEPPIFYPPYTSRFAVKELFRGSLKECEKYIRENGLEEV